MGQQTHSTNEHQLFLSVADQVNEAVTYLAQLGKDNTAHSANTADWHAVYTLANALQQVTSGYMTSLHMQNNAPKRVPVTLSALLHDTARTLGPYAHQYGVPLTLDIAPRLQPVTANGNVLSLALINIGQVFVRSVAESEYTGGIKLVAHRSRYGVVAGVYAAHNEMLTTPRLRRAIHLAGQSMQPCGVVNSGPAAGIFVAEALLQSLATKLHVARYRTLTGLAATLPSCSQLQLV